MTKITKIVAAGLLVAPFIGNSQVSTAVEKKTPILEEYTGNNCTYCPDGHMIADDIEATVNGAITLKIQTGGFSGTDPIFGGTLETPTGELIAAPFDSQGYPNGTVNRRTAYEGIGRGDWKSAAQAIASEDAPVNLLVTSDIDVATRQLDVTVEYYYTANETNSTNYLHIGYYQDNVAAYQYDPGFNPDGFYVLNQAVYEFDHAFRDMVNGTWGEVINATTATSTASVTRSVTLPPSFSTFDVDPAAIKVFAFISTTDQGEILNAAKATPTYNNFPNTEDVFTITADVNNSEEECIGSEHEVSPIVLVGTSGGNTLTALDVDYGMDGNTSTYNWTGSLKPGEKEAITLPESTFTVASSNVLSATISNPNGVADLSSTDNSENGFYNLQGISRDANALIIITETGQYGDILENQFEIVDGTDKVVFSSGVFGADSRDTTIFPIPAGTDCYHIRMYSSPDYDGAYGWYEGTFTVKGNNFKKIDKYTDEYNGWLTKAIEITSEGSWVSVEEEKISQTGLFPNPTSGDTRLEFNVNSSSNVTINVMNTLGQTVINENLGYVNGNQSVNLNGSNLNNGLYLVNIQIGNETITQKLTVSK